VPTIEQIETAKAFLLSVLASAYPDFDFRETRVLREIMVDPFSYLAAVQNSRLTDLEAELTLLTLDEDPESMSAEALDRLLANYFVERTDGTQASGVVRVVTESPTSYVVPSGSLFTAGALQFETTAVYVASTSPSTGQGVQISEYGDNYVANIPVTASEVGTDYNLRIGTAFEWVDPTVEYVSIFAESNFTGGANTETNTELAARVDESRSSKTFATRPSVEAGIKEIDPSIESVETIGAGDTELVRGTDNLFGTRLTDNVDVYVKRQTFESTITLTGTITDKSKKLVTITVGNDVFPGFYEITELRPRGDTEPQPFETTNIGVSTAGLEDHYIPAVTSLDAAFTRYQTRQIVVSDLNSDFTDKVAGDEVSYDADFIGLTGLDTVQDTLQLRARRPVSGSYLVKAAIPVFVSVDLEVYNPDSEAIDTEAVQIAVAEAITATPIGTRRLLACNIVSAASSVLPDSVSVREPIFASARILLPDLSTRTVTNTYGVTIPDDLPLSVTSRICGMYCTQGAVSVTTSTTEA